MTVGNKAKNEQQQKNKQLRKIVNFHGVLFFARFFYHFTVRKFKANVKFPLFN